MPTKADLLLEKRRYGLPEVVSELELKLLAQDMPVQKIIGYIEMQEVKIQVSRNVLIPRYETEELILWVKEDLKSSFNLRILDLCTGSGFIGLALKKTLPNNFLILSDISDQAILQARENANLNNLEVEIIKSDLFSNLQKNSYDVIVSNPPYLIESEVLSKSVLNYEPHEALFARDNGLYFYKEIIKNAPEYLKDQKGVLYFEINPLHEEFWISLAKELKIELRKDINNRLRMAKITFE
ncbi:peptide chain release factor N(5)-glutamine methyltransferase [Mycoplasmopsis glycophila]|uniref:peptide chain release factor N(5)-glutamine methyltransferase n=1 Tax=Mycoplasmopsis glycophila TaxID=171285 RepID=A0A449AV40_9BACT|nr:peptide chain release factor N(5)-glutamine methyltransferase [Mycoplasmopsis glycophila]VEU70365.1 protoporphyrinogen oxidase [Mycoplasmopsis glycophila]